MSQRSLIQKSWPYLLWFKCLPSRRIDCVVGHVQIVVNIVAEVVDRTMRMQIVQIVRGKHVELVFVVLHQLVAATSSLQHVFEHFELALLVFCSKCITCLFTTKAYKRYSLFNERFVFLSLQMILWSTSRINLNRITMNTPDFSRWKKSLLTHKKVNTFRRSLTILSSSLCFIHSFDRSRRNV